MCFHEWKGIYILDLQNEGITIKVSSEVHSALADGTMVCPPLVTAGETFICIVSVEGSEFSITTEENTIYSKGMALYTNIISQSLSGIKPIPMQ